MESNPRVESPNQGDCDIVEIELTSKNPMKIFQEWIKEAKDQPSLNPLPETMTLSTVRKDGGPSSRSLLLRGFDDDGFKMYWDKNSRKSEEVTRDSRGSLVFVWHIRSPQGNQELRQVRIEGVIEEIPEKESSEYFASEPLMAKIRAVVCRQSQVVTPSRRQQINDEVNKMWKLGCPNIPAPNNWGGYKLQPTVIEFYKGRKDAINDRIRFSKESTGEPGIHWETGENGWIYERLEP